MKRKRDLAGTNETLGNPSLLSADEVKSLLDTVNSDRDTLLSLIATEKVTPRIEKLRVAINSFSDAIMKISGAYLATLGANDAYNACFDNISRCARSFERTCQRIDCIESTVASLLPTSAGDRYPPATSYAKVLSNSVASKESANKVSLSRGISFPIRTVQRTIIGPVNDDADNCSSKLTKDALFKAIDPTALKLRVSYRPKNSVIVEGDSIDRKVIAECESFKSAGLEIKNDSKLNPRLAIHDIPVNIQGESIINSIVEQNLQGVSPAHVKLVYLYPARDKKYRTCIIETSPSVRDRLLSCARVSIGWVRCRVDDYVSILQCFKCSGFGHTAKHCKKTVCCSSCSGEHLFSSCTQRDNLRCINCVNAKSVNVSHSATDKDKCPLLRRKIEQKISCINYAT